MRQNYVVGFAFSEDRSQVVLIRKNHPDWQAGKMNGGGGKINPHEDGISCMVREFEKETGVITQPEEWECFTARAGLDPKSNVYYCSFQR